MTSKASGSCYLDSWKLEKFEQRSQLTIANLNHNKAEVVTPVAK